MPVQIEVNTTGMAIRVDENTVGQYTGLHDKNNVEIYERGYSTNT